MILSVTLIAMGCLVAMFDFKGFMLTDDNYEIVREIERYSVTQMEHEPVSQPKKTLEDDVNSAFHNSNNQQASEQYAFNQPPPNAPNTSTEPKKYGTVQGGQQFADKSPKDFMKFN